MRFGGKILFKNGTIQLNPGQHYGLVGANGSGKSTLIKILVGDTTPETGDVAVPSSLNIGTLKQDHFLYEDVRIIDTVLMGKRKLWEALEAKHVLLQHEHFTEEECHKLEALDKVISAYHGYAAESQAAKLLEGLGLPDKVHANPMKTLSGGYKLRVLLAQVLFSEPEILLLDEPTNHLDLFSIRWLEGYLKEFPGTLLISSHDRDFLNGVCNNIVDLDFETIKIYKGNYDAFLLTKESDKVLKESQLEKQDKKREDLQDFVDRFKAKASKARQAASKMKLVEKLSDEIETLNIRPSTRRYPRLNFEQVRPSGAVALKVTGICKSYGTKQVLNGISFEVDRGDKIAFLGPNGIGKSTLLEILANNLKSDHGAFQWGHAAQVAYFPQDHARIVHGKATLMDWLKNQEPQASDQAIRDVLGRMLFSGDDAAKPVDVLSGGETARLVLAKMMLQKHNILIFDEPTNHLDMEAAEILLESLQAYPGTLLVVSHNRHFVSHLADRIIELTPDGLEDFRCSFAEYLEKRDIDHLSATAKRPVVKEEKAADAKLSHEEQKKLRNAKAQREKKAAQAEDNYHRLEKAMQAIDEKLMCGDFYHNASPLELEELMRKKSTLEKELEVAFKEWESLL